MRVIKKINNNAAICLDDNNNELVALGKGIGFPQVPYTLDTMEKIEHTYYDVDTAYHQVLNQIPEEVMDLSAKIVDDFKAVSMNAVSPNLVFTLADHIAFCIERQKKGIRIANPLHYEIMQSYPFEFEQGQNALRTIRKQMKIRLPKEEASSIAIHFVNSQADNSFTKGTTYMDRVIDEITNEISDTFRIYIDRGSFNYSRFVSHVYYLLKRDLDDHQLNTENAKMYEVICETYPKSAACIDSISEYLSDEMDLVLNKEEKLYLILHLNRLISRQGA